MYILHSFSAIKGKGIECQKVGMRFGSSQSMRYYRQYLSKHLKVNVGDINLVFSEVTIKNLNFKINRK